MSENNQTKINIVNCLQTKINNTTTKANLNLLGTVLLDKYTINSKINAVSGEAELYRCTDNDQNEYVVKIYQRENAIKPEIIDKIKSINSPNVAKIVDTGAYKNYPFVVLPYYSNGSLVEAVLSKGMTFDLDELKQFVIPSLNNGLKVLHDNGIIHKDLKPANIMISDDGTSLVIIDFGISSDTNGGTVVVTKTGMTPTYLAPEALSNTYLKETDYYALGITIYELFTGRTPYENLNEEQIASYASIQKIPYPLAFPKPLKNLINGLTYKDLSNRNDKNNPNRRWVFEDVQQWLDADGDFTLETDASNEQKNSNSSKSDSNNSETKQNFMYIFKLQEYRDINSLAEQLLRNSEEGVKEFGRGYLSKKLRQTGEERLARICEDAEAGLDECQSRDDEYKLFINLVYTIAPTFNKIVWNGLTFTDIVDYGNALIDEVCNNNCQNTELIESSEIFMYNEILKTWSIKHANKETAELYVKILDVSKKYLDNNAVETKYFDLGLGSALTGRVEFVLGNQKYQSYQSVQNLEKELEELYKTNLIQYNEFFDKNYQEMNKISIFLPSNFKAIILNILNTFENHKKFEFFVDAHHVYRNLIEFDSYVNTLKSQGTEVAAEFFESKFRNITRAFNRLNNSDKELFKNRYPEFKTTAVIGEIKVGNTVQFGKYFINSVGSKILNLFSNKDNKKQPLEWLVLEVSDNKALLITKYAIDGQQYNKKKGDVTWEKCSLRKWLNTKFLNEVFSKDEQSEILVSDISNPNNSEFKISGGNSTQDKVFLLSIEEAKKYFTDSNRWCKPTAYAKQQGIWLFTDQNDEYFRKEFYENCSWWLRSPGLDKNHATIVCGNGDIGTRGQQVDTTINAVRPALYIEIVN